MNYFKNQMGHYYMVRKTDILHVSLVQRLINTLDLDFFYIHERGINATGEVFDKYAFQDSTEEEFMDVLSTVLGNLNLPVK